MISLKIQAPWSMHCCFLVVLISLNAIAIETGVLILVCMFVAFVYFLYINFTVLIRNDTWIGGRIDHRVYITILFTLFFICGPLTSFLIQSDSADFISKPETTLFVMNINILGYIIFIAFYGVLRKNQSKRTSTKVETSSIMYTQNFRIYLAYSLISVVIAVFYVNETLSEQRNIIVFSVLKVIYPIVYVVIFSTLLSKLMFKELMLIQLLSFGSILYVSISLAAKNDVVVALCLFSFALLIRTLKLRYAIIPIAVVFVFVEVIGGPYLSARNEYSYYKKDFPSKVDFLIKEDTPIYSDYSVSGRIDYTYFQAKAIEFYDTENGGKDFEKLFWVVVPRILYPEKPTMTDSATELYTKIRGHEGAAIGIGVFVDGYYNLGIFGVILSSVMLACFASAVSVLSKDYGSQRYPFNYLSFFMALLYSASFLGGIIPSVVGGGVIVIATVILFKYLNVIFGSFNKA